MGFRRLLHTMAPHYKIPARSTTTEKISAKAEAISSVQRESLAEADNITLTSDLWTDPLNSKSYMGSTINFLRKNDFESIRLGVMRMTGAHTAENIAEHFDQLMLTWNITNSRINNSKLQSTIDKVKAIVTFSRESVQVTERLESVQVSEGKKALKLKQDI
jgi:hypothetical protein